MPGFGSGSFGSGPFGSWDWSRVTLWEYIPPKYRELDEPTGLFQAFMDAVRPQYDELRFKIRDMGELRDPDTIRTRYGNEKPIRLGKLLQNRGEIERRGLDGSVPTLTAYVTSAMARFRDTDRGKALDISKSSVPSNNRTVIISAIISETQVATVPSLAADAGPFKWELRGNVISDGNSRMELRSGDVDSVRPRYSLNDGPANYTVLERLCFAPSSDNKHFTEKEGTGYLDSYGRLVAAGAGFTQWDLGKKIGISNSAYSANEGWFEIAKIIDGNTVAFSVLEIANPAAVLGLVRYYMVAGTADVRIKHTLVTDPAAWPVSLAVTVTDSDVEVTLATDGAGVITSTAIDVVTAVLASSTASLLVKPEYVGTGLGLVVETTDFLTVFGEGVLPDTTVVNWALLKFPQITLQGNVTPAGIVEQEGDDISISAGPPGSYVVTSATANFSVGDLGKTVTLWGQDYPLTVSEVLAVLSANAVLVSGTPYTIPGTPIRWELRKKTLFLDTITLLVSPPSQMEWFTQDFGIITDSLDNDLRQRRYVGSANQWIDLKSSAAGYVALGAIAGAEVTTTKLFRVSLPNFLLVQSIDPAYVMEVLEPGPGHTGALGSLPVINATIQFNSSSNQVTFLSSDAIFTTADIGRQIKIEGGLGTCFNADPYYLIIKTLSPANKVESEPIPVADWVGAWNTPLTGFTRWSLVRLYATVEPQRPNYDDINSDILSTWVATNVGGKSFLPDKFCWESDFAAYVNVTVNSVTAVSYGIWLIDVTTVGMPANGVESVASVGQWKLVDSSGMETFIETIPALVAPAHYQFNVSILTSPALGAGRLQYVCPVADTCDYCGSYRIRADITYDVSTYITPAEVSDVENRILKKLYQSLPMHAELVPVFKPRLTATIKTSATVVI